MYDFIDRLREGRFNAAYKAFRNASGFPAVAARFCSQPCREACPLDSEGSQPIEINLLEKACLMYADKKEPTEYNLPVREKKIAIIGGGISGMACAMRLATKRFMVTVFEKSEKIGGTLWDIMDSSVFLDDFKLQMKYLDYELQTGCEVKDLGQIISQGFHAVYVSTGRDGNDFGLSGTLSGKPCMVKDGTGILAGGSLLGHDRIYALGDGLAAATAIDNFLMTKNLIYPEYNQTQMMLDDSRMIPSQAVMPSRTDSEEKGGSYTEEEAVEEAERCLRCQCDACRIWCDLTEYVHKWPLRIRDEIIATTAPGSADIKATPAKRLINTCTQCGLCKETCPESIDLGGLILAARSRMHSLDKMPWVFNDFFLRDMDFSNSDTAYLCHRAPHEHGSAYAFFPGCQLGASDPDLVIRSYTEILRHQPDSGIMLGCCGVPAVWAGDDEKHQEELSRIKTDWESLGRPVMILACPTCMDNFRKYLPEIKAVFLYDLMAEWFQHEGFPSAARPDMTYSIFDPCPTKPGDSVRRSVRSICSGLDIHTEPLALQKKFAACCSYGGHGSIADPDFAEAVREKRVSESSNPYIVYCINCRDAFLGKGKKVYHILDLLFGCAPKLSTATARRENRAWIKERILKEIFGEKPCVSPAVSDGTVMLEISGDLKEKISSQHLLEEDICEVVAFCERTGRTVYDPEKNSFSGYRKVGRMTHWVEYKRTGDPGTFILINAYCHRMEIELEAVWNGHKINIIE